MNEALDSVRYVTRKDNDVTYTNIVSPAFSLGTMSINQAAIHYNLPYSSLYGRFKRGKYDIDGCVISVVDGGDGGQQMDQSSENSVSERRPRVS